MSERKEHTMILPLDHMAGIPSNILDQSGLRIARCDFDGQMCQEANDNAAYIIKCVNEYSCQKLPAKESYVAACYRLEQQLAASQSREAELRKCVALYADQTLWQKWLGEPRLWVSTVGPKPAQACLDKLKGGGV